MTGTALIAVMPVLMGPLNSRHIKTQRLPWIDPGLASELSARAVRRQKAHQARWLSYREILSSPMLAVRRRHQTSVVNSPS